MGPDIVTEDLLRRYLLGQLDEASQQRVEESLMTDAAFALRLDFAEEDLVDEYAAGSLDSGDLERFNRLFIADPGRQRDIRFARTLREYVASQSATPATAPDLGWWARLSDFVRPEFQAALALSSIALFVVGGWLLYRANRLQHQLDGMVAAQPALSSEQTRLARELADEKNRRSRLEQEVAALKAQARNPAQSGPGSQAEFVAITLFPGLSRDSGSTPRLVFPGGKDRVRLTLIIEDAPYPVYEVSVRTPEGKQVWRRGGLRAVNTPEGQAVVLQLSREALKPEDYVIRLTGIAAGGAAETAGTYYLRVSPK